jgi:hypothetical protein
MLAFLLLIFLTFNIGGPAGFNNGINIVGLVPKSTPLKPCLLLGERSGVAA